MKQTHRLLLNLFAFLITSNTIAQVYHQNGMVVSEHHLASEVGSQILQSGGNAIDASIATAFALAVVFPQAGNIGGGGFWCIWMMMENQQPLILGRKRH